MFLKSCFFSDLEFKSRDLTIVSRKILSNHLNRLTGLKIRLFTCTKTRAVGLFCL